MVSHIGKSSVANYIKQLGQRSFKVSLEGSKAPIYSSGSKTNDQAVREFVNFSDNILSGNKEDSNIYHITIYKDSSAKIPSVLSETFFQYNEEKENSRAADTVGSSYNPHSLNEMFGLMGRMIEIVQPFATQKAENQMLKAHIDDIESDPEPEKESTLNTLIAALAPALLKQPGTAAVNGVQTEEGVNVDILNTAIEKLLVVDPDLPSDLMKLAEIAETKPQFFHTLLSTLRNM